MVVELKRRQLFANGGNIILEGRKEDDWVFVLVHPTKSTEFVVPTSMRVQRVIHPAKLVEARVPLSRLHIHPCTADSYLGYTRSHVLTCE